MNVFKPSHFMLTQKQVFIKSFRPYFESKCQAITVLEISCKIFNYLNIYSFPNTKHTSIQQRKRLALSQLDKSPH